MSGGFYNLNEEVLSSLDLGQASISRIAFNEFRAANPLPPPPALPRSAPLLTIGEESVIEEIGEGGETTISFAAPDVVEAVTRVSSSEDVASEIGSQLWSDISEDVSRGIGERIGATVAAEAAEGAVSGTLAGSTAMFAAGGALGILMILATFIPVILALKRHTAPTYQTTVRLTNGGIGWDDEHKINTEDLNQEGSVPHFKIWDDFGNLLGTSQSDSNGHLAAGETRTFPIQHESASAMASYLSVSMHESDAICIVQLRLERPNGVAFSWLGDMGYACGAPWYYNSIPVTQNGHYPRCVWLDQDNTSGNAPYSAMAMHMPDYVLSPGRTLQYAMHAETLCESTPRFQMYEHFGEDDWHSFYNPILEYNATTLEDLDISRVIHNKGDKFGHYQPEHHFMKALGDIDEHRERNPRFHPHLQPSASAKPSALFHNATSEDRRPQASDKPSPPVKRAARPYLRQHESHLVTSDYKRHSAKHLCASDTSLGPDFINTREHMFCDMSTKEVWPLCGNPWNHTHSCFDYEKKIMRGPESGLGRRDEKSGREIPYKTYKTENLWRWGTHIQHNKLDEEN